jgi:L-fuconolactonase
MSDPSDESAGATVVLDSHIHFWDTRRLDYPWLREFPRLERPFLPEDLDVGEIQVDAMVFVQANPLWSQVEDETAWVLGLGSKDGRIQGVVAGVPLDRGSDSVADWLGRLALMPGVAGVRQLIQGEPVGFALEPEFVDAVRLAGEQGLVVDLCVASQQLTEVASLVERCPEVTFVLDHLGKPDIRAGESVDWAKAISRIARHPNVYCKLSGLTSEAYPGTSDGTFCDYLRTGIDVFGPDRCLFGSDWPNASMQISYPGWVALVLTASSDLAPAERNRIMSRTARYVYARAWDRTVVAGLEAYD